MRTTANTETHSASGIGHVTPWNVTAVQPLAGFRLKVEFADGARGIVDMACFLARECGVFKPLREAALFNQVCVDNGAVTWPGELDLAPDRMHEELRKAEVYVVR